MIPKCDGFEAGLEPVESVLGMGTSVHKIADAEKAIPDRVELDLEKRNFERAEAAVDITDHEVSPDLVETDSMGGFWHHRLPVQR